MLAWAVPLGPICLSAACRGPLGWTVPGLAPVRLPEAAVASAGGTGARARAPDCGVRRCGAVRAVPAGRGWGVCAAVFSTLAPGLSSVASKLGAVQPLPCLWAPGDYREGFPEPVSLPHPGRARTPEASGLQPSVSGGCGVESQVRGHQDSAADAAGPTLVGGWRITGVVRGLVGLACVCWR